MVLVVEAKNLGFCFGDLPVLREVEFAVSEREVVALVGPSGCGKTTLLRLIAGLENCGESSLYVVSDDTGRRALRFLFQDYDAYPWLNVWDNVKVGSGPPPYTDDDKVGTVLERVRLVSEAHRYPAELSGGMRKRLALARCLARDPRLLLLDEPFASLDVDAKFDMYALIQEIVRITGTSVIIVTHDLSEAVFLSDRVLICSQRPMSIRGEIEVPLPKPRDPSMMRDAMFLNKLADLHAALQPGGTATLGSRSHAIDRDSERGRELRLLLKEPSRVELLSDLEICGLVDECLHGVARVRMGGRSSSLMALCPLLWHGAARRDVVVRLSRDVERVASLALQCCVDPSFAQPEWGVIVVGVVLDRWVKFSKGIWAGTGEEKDKFLEQVRRILEYFASPTEEGRCGPPVVPLAVREASRALIEQWGSGFTMGLQPVVDSALGAWPATDAVRSLSDEQLREETARLSTCLPASVGRADLMLYRLLLERGGDWLIFETVGRYLVPKGNE